ncbi:MAG: hypothetical protein IPG61_04690 [bacterium]|nr:hypothetical protein [bacterium]
MTFADHQVSRVRDSCAGATARRPHRLRPAIERILAHIGEATRPPAVLPARSPSQLAFGFDQAIATTDWPAMDQSAG